MNRNLFSKDFLKEYFKTDSQRGYNIAYRSCKKPIARKKGLLHNKLWESHCSGKVTIYLSPSRKDVCYWATLDVDVLKKGETLTFEGLNKNSQHLSTLKWCLNKTGLSENKYLFILNGRGFHLHFFFNTGVPSSIAYDFLKIIKSSFEDEYFKATGIEPEWKIDLRPEKSIGAKACIQLPGYNFVTERFAVPFIIDNSGMAKEVDALPQIQKAPIDTVISIIVEFKKG